MRDENHSGLRQSIKFGLSKSNVLPVRSHDRLSWGLLYAALVTTMSFLMSIIATYTALFPNSDFFIIFFLIFLYGISSVSRVAMEIDLKTI